jgi:predicted transcriptional regulator
MKTIIEVARRDSIFDAALTDVESGGNPDCVLAFESARALFAEITPARLDLLDALRRGGACSVYALAKTVGRNYSNVHADISKLIELNLVERTEDDREFVPFDALEIRMPLTTAA